MIYTEELWFALLQAACKANQRKDVAIALGVSAPLISQVLNQSGKYGEGTANTKKLAERVIHTYGRYTCPYLTEQYAEDRVITADQCRAYAHRPPPANGPRDLQHWRACTQCPHKAHSALPEPREPKPRTHQPRRTAGNQ